MANYGERNMAGYGLGPVAPREESYPRDCAEARQSELRAQLQALAGVQGYTASLIEQLRSRLDCVLRPPSPVNCATDKQQCPSTEVGMALASRKEAGEDFNRALLDILDRLEV